MYHTDGPLGRRQTNDSMQPQMESVGVGALWPSADGESGPVLRRGAVVVLSTRHTGDEGRCYIKDPIARAFAWPCVTVSRF